MLNFILLHLFISWFDAAHGDTAHGDTAHGFFFPMCSRTYDTMKREEMHKKLVCFKQKYWYLQGFPGGSVGEESACNVGNLALIPGSGRSPRKGNGNPCQYSCLENSVDTGARRATGHGVAEWDSQAQLSMTLSPFTLPLWCNLGSNPHCVPFF